MNHIEKIGNYFYLSIYQNRVGNIAPALVRIKSLEQLNLDGGEDIYDVLGFKGVPYFFTYFDGGYYLTEIDMYSSIKQLEVNESDLHVAESLFENGPYDESSLQRRKYKYI